MWEELGPTMFLVFKLESKKSSNSGRVIPGGDATFRIAFLESDNLCPCKSACVSILTIQPMARIKPTLVSFFGNPIHRIKLNFTFCE